MVIFTIQEVSKFRKWVHPLYLVIRNCKSVVRSSQFAVYSSS